MSNASISPRARLLSLYQIHECYDIILLRTGASEQNHDDTESLARPLLSIAWMLLMLGPGAVPFSIKGHLLDAESSPFLTCAALPLLLACQPLGYLSEGEQEIHTLLVFWDGRFVILGLLRLYLYTVGIQFYLK